MSQSTVAVAALFGLFLIYITAKGQLPCYLNVFGLSQGGSNCPQPASSSSSSSTATGSSGLGSVSSAVTVANSVLNTGASIGAGNQDFSGGEAGTIST